MGFSGGGSNVLKSHTHDGTVTQDGGPLNFNNITQSQSAAGEVFYSDGVHLQQLAYPGVPAGETLTAAAASTAPSWAVAGGTQQIELVDHTELGASATEINTAIAPAISGDDIACLLVYVNAVPDGSNDVRVQINGNTSGYYTDGMKMAGGAITYNDQNNQAYFRVTAHQGGNEAQTAAIHIFTGATAMTTATPKVLNYLVSGHCGAGASTWDNGGNTATGTTTINRVRIFVSAGNLLAGSSLSIYKINVV